MVKIEKGIPIAPHGNTGKRKSKYPLADMEVGDSFVAKRVKRAALYSAIYSATMGKGKCLGRKFTIRSTEGGFRVWRTA